MTLSEKLKAEMSKQMQCVPPGEWGSARRLLTAGLREGARIALQEQERRMMNEAEFFPWSPAAMLKELEEKPNA